MGPCGESADPSLGLLESGGGSGEGVREEPGLEWGWAAGPQPLPLDREKLTLKGRLQRLWRKRMLRIEVTNG